MKARPVVPGSVIFLTRRIHKRQFLLRPSERLNKLLEYILAVVAERYEIALHAVCVMSNHWHVVLSDPHGSIVDFERDCHSVMARAVNTMYGDFESLWAREPSCRVQCAEPEDALDKIAYTLANPVEAGLVKFGKDWPGLRFTWARRPRVVERPTVFFRDEKAGGRWPKLATLVCHRPPGFERHTDDELEAKISAATEARELSAREGMHGQGKRFLGRRGVRKQSRSACATSDEQRCGARPRVAARSKWARIELLQQNDAWLEAYEDAKARFRGGDSSAVFPFGTWKLRRYYSCLCDPPPDAIASAA